MVPLVDRAATTITNKILNIVYKYNCIQFQVWHITFQHNEKYNHFSEIFVSHGNPLSVSCNFFRAMR